MPGNILVTYATRYGSTREVAEEIASTLREGGFGVAIQPAREVRTLAGYRAVVLGAALYMYRWHKDALGFLSRHRKALMEIPVAVFILGPTHQPHDDNEWRDSRAQYDKELAKYPWFSPIAIEMFGGKFDPQSLRFPINLLAGQEPASDIRDWTAIRAWASSLVKKL